MHIAELTDDYLQHSGRYIRIYPGGHNEAPAIFKKDNTYWMITSGCTGWDPNAARMFSASSIWGPWKQHPNPCRGENSEKTFGGQSTFVLELPENRFIFMADVWKPKSLMYSGHIWLPIQFDEKGVPFIEWTDKQVLPTNPVRQSEWKQVWSDEFNTDGLPDTTVWSYDNGFARNEEAQWYQKGNAYCKDGKLIIEVRKEEGRKNPWYEAGSNDWRKKREFIEYTSSCITTAGKKEFLYGRFEIRAKIPVSGGAWPAIWTLGSGMDWPRVAKSTSWNIIASKAYRIFWQMPPGELTGSGMRNGRAKQFLSLISRTKIRRGRISFTSGVWIGMKRPLKSIWMMNC